MSDSGDEMLSSESISCGEETSSSDDEMEIVGHVQPYEDEPLAHPSDDEEDIVDDQDGLSPAVLRARFAGETSVNKW